MNTLIDVFVGNETLIDPGIYQLWLDGQTVENAAKIQQKKGTLLQFGATFEMLTNEIEDQYRTFKLLENYLKNPIEMSFQLELQLTPEMQSQLIEKYYEFDSLVVREFIGRKLSTRLRNSLDDISDKTKVSVRSCKRQFDNVKQVFKVVEDLPGSIVNNITSNFLLSSPLAQQYAAMVFITTNRFDLTKKKLSYLTFQDFVHCANVIMNSWSTSLNDVKDADANDADLDRDFLQEMKEVKVILEKENMEEHRQLLMLSVKSRVSQDYDNYFKVFSKVIITIGTNLNHNKDLKDFFTDIVEKCNWQGPSCISAGTVSLNIIEPCRNLNWEMQDLKAFLYAYQQTCPQLNVINKSNKSQQMVTCWNRYMDTMVSCIIQMYHE